MSCINAVRSIAAVLGMCVLLLAGCGRHAAEREIAPPKVAFTDFGLAIEFAEPVELERLIVRTRERDVVQEIPLAGRRQRIEVPFGWAPRGEYAFELVAEGRRLTVAATAPGAARSLAASLEAPSGQAAVRFGETDVARTLVPDERTLPFGIVIENLRQRSTRIELELRPSPDVELRDLDPRFHVVAANQYRLTAELSAQHDYLQMLCGARITSDAETARIEIALRPLDVKPIAEETIVLELRRVTHEQLAALVEPGEIVFPSDPLGRRQPERQADTVVLPDAVWSTVRRWLQPAGATFNYHAPYAFQAIPLTNRSEVPLNLLVESEVVAAHGTEPLLSFAPPAWAAPRESATAEHVVRVAPGETAAAIVPLFVRADTAPGDYERRFRVSLLGSTVPLFARDVPLRVIRGNPVVAGVAAAALVTTLLAWIGFATFGRRMIGGLGTTALAVIGMLAALHFAVSFGSRVAGDVIAAFAGPFAIFISGIGNEGLTCLVLAALVVLVPRPGTVTVSSLTVFLLNAMFTGQFGLVDVIFVTVSIVCTELLLALAGVTTHLRAGVNSTTTFSAWSERWRTAAALGLANGLVLFAQFCLMQVLVRLFFATWYVAAVALVAGLLYGSAGALAGAALGQRLRSTAR